MIDFGRTQNDTEEIDMQHTLKWIVGAATAVIGAMSSAQAADRVLSADEVRKLITGNTVHVTQIRTGKSWKIYFAPDGKGYESEGDARGTWEVKDNGEHCVSWGQLTCARIVESADGTYGRVDSMGRGAVTWKVEAGKHL